METIKRYDVRISLGLIITGTLHSLIKMDETFIYWYFIVGGWQVISMVTHGFNGWFCKNKSSRYYYHITVAVIIAIALLGFLITPLLIIFYVLLFASPFMAVYYTLLCNGEVKELKYNRTLSLK